MSDATNDANANADRNNQFRRSASADADQDGLSQVYLERFKMMAVLPISRESAKAVDELDLETVNRARARAGLDPLPA